MQIKVCKLERAKVSESNNGWQLLARLNLSAPCFSTTVLNVHTLKLGALPFVRYVLFTFIAKIILCC